MDTGGSFPGGEAAHPPLASAQVKKLWIYTSSPPYAFMFFFFIAGTQSLVLRPILAYCTSPGW
jgi:hypothetical protein